MIWVILLRIPVFGSLSPYLNHSFNSMKLLLLETHSRTMLAQPPTHQTHLESLIDRAFGPAPLP